MEEYINWNHFISVISISALVFLSPQSLTSLVRTPIGLAVVILAIASITADAPALGILALALVITEKQEIEGFEVESEDPDSVSKIIRRLRKGVDWRSKHCVDENGVQVFKDINGNVVGKTKAASILTNVTFAEGCDPNPCARSCVALVS
jgi:hypothetical protein